MEGRIHSVESFGTVDGPGIRFVVFFQGCPMRCQYCHNPDTWDYKGGRLQSAESLIAQMEKNRGFYSGGGLTITGGEPLLQPDFASELFSLAHAKGFHTCLDTSGICWPGLKGKIDEVLDHTDLVMLDIKHIDSEVHKSLTGQKNTGILDFARHLNDRKIPVWIRHVVVPGITDNQNALARLGNFLGTLSNVKALDVLPYHTMGLSKYKELGIPYPLERIPPAQKAEAVKARNQILAAYRAAKLK